MVGMILTSNIHAPRKGNLLCIVRRKEAYPLDHSGECAGGIGTSRKAEDGDPIPSFI